MKFLKTVSLDQAVNLLNQHCTLPRENEMVKLEDSLGRCLFADLLASEDIPYYNRSTVDGYAVVSLTTQGASESIPVVLKSLGSIPIGTMTTTQVTPEATLYVPTGGMVPQGADAMVMIEDTRVLDDLVLIQKSVPPGSNLVLQGEDVAQGQLVLPKGHCLKSQDIAALASLNQLQVPVLKRPNVFIISTGDEFASPQEELTDGKIRDINSHSLAALCRETGLNPVGTTLVRDDLEEIRSAIRQGLDQADLVLLSGGSSAGERDYTKQAILDLGGDILFHGIRIKPGKPTIGASIQGKAVIGLPGHPVSAMMLFKTLVTDFFREQTRSQVPRVMVKARTRVNFPSQPGRLTCQFLTLSEQDGELFCQPYYSNSALVSQLTQAQGFTLIPEEAEGLDAGTVVDVILL
ncbi:Molybdopterin molybdenumtransferase [anaerobic digester metagenome]|nr:molybdopterin molybdotransferase MoeA [Clostridiaceae bacterium HFYG-1003]